MRRLFLMILALLVVLPGTAMIAAAQSTGIESACLVTDVGKVNDGTFNQFAYEGMLGAAEEADLDVTYVETQAQTDYANNLQTCIDEGFDAIVTVGFLLADATLAAAQANPDVFFIGVDQFVFEGPANYVGIQFREDQSAFLVGALAALTTESNIVGGVFGIDIPPVVRFRNGYEQGINWMATQLGKEISILGVYIDSFTAPDRGAAAAEQFVGEGVDVLFGGGGPTGSGAIVAGAAEGVYVIGVDQDEFFTTFDGGETPGADKLISSGIKRVDVGVYNMLITLAEGELDAFPGGGNYILDVANGGMTFAGPNEADVNPDFYTIVESIEMALAEGTLVTGVNPDTAEIELSIEEIIEQSTFEIDLSAVMSS